MISNEEIKRLFRLYLDGKADARQKEILFRCLDKDKADERSLTDVTNEVWNSEAFPREDSRQADHEFEELWGKIDLREQRKRRSFKIMKYAASILLVCSAALIWHQFQLGHVEEEKPIVMLRKTTLSGEKVKLILPDSSVVYLSGSSTLKWPSRFVKGRNRNITLNGEGFFEVKRDTLSPFIVHTGKMQTQVLGTSFNIYAYPGEDIYNVAVRTGKVKVSECSGGAVKKLSLLTPGLMLEYRQQNRRYKIGSAKTAEINSWVNNRFIFKDATLRTMLAKLEKYYLVKFKIEPSCLTDKRQFNATFDQKNIREVMEQVSLMSGRNIHYKMNSDSLINVWGEGCK